jgi:hypothetical protein
LNRDTASIAGFNGDCSTILSAITILLVRRWGETFDLVVELGGTVTSGVQLETVGVRAECVTLYATKDSTVITTATSSILPTTDKQSSKVRDLELSWRDGDPRVGATDDGVQIRIASNF